MAKSKASKQDIFVSTVVVAKMQTRDLASYIINLSKELVSLYENYEIIIIDNLVPVEEIVAINKLLSQYPCIRLIRLSRQFKHDTAVFSGLEAAIGDYVVVIDPTLDPIEHISKVIEKNKEIDIIQGVSTMPIKGVLGTDVGRNLFYWYNRKYLGMDIHQQSTYFMSLSRRAVNALTSSNRHDKHVRHLLKVIGYKFAIHDYEPLQDPSTQRSLRTSILQALEIVSNYSTHPLRFVTWLGFFAGVINLFYAGYVVVVSLLKDDIEPGWTTMSIQLSVMFFILFTILVILCEYIGRILGESRKDPQYLIMDEQSSTVSLADVERKNITKD
jgi:glycosyltransferase involved in cell wall biosynthesis